MTRSGTLRTTQHIWWMGLMALTIDVLPIKYGHLADEAAVKSTVGAWQRVLRWTKQHGTQDTEVYRSTLPYL